MKRDDVARLAGVSKSTVSRVINGNGYVSGENRKKIEEAIRELGYRPNLIARSLKTKETRQILYYSPEMLNPFYMQVYQGMEDLAEKNGYTIVLSCHFDEAMVRQRQFDGVILSRFSLGLSAEAMKINAPVVVTDYVEHGGSGPSVSIGFREGAYAGVRHLTELGHRKIAFLTGTRDWNDERMQGYLRALRDADIGLDDRLIADGGGCANGYEQGYRMAGRLADEARDFTALFAFNDIMAIGAMAALAERGIRTPQDVSVLGYDDILESRYANPPLTTVNVPKYEMGWKSMEMMLCIIGGGQPQPVQLETRLVIRSSTREYKR